MFKLFLNGSLLLHAALIGQEVQQPKHVLLLIKVDSALQSTLQLTINGVPTVAPAEWKSNMQAISLPISAAYECIATAPGYHPHSTRLKVQQDVLRWIVPKLVPSEQSMQVQSEPSNPKFPTQVQPELLPDNSRLTIQVQPEVKGLIQMRINGVVLEPAASGWETNTKVITLPTGPKYELVAAAHGHSTETATLELKAGQHGTWNPKLRPSLPKLTISVPPELRGVIQLSINGELLSPSPASWASNTQTVTLPIGPDFKLSATAPGYSTEKATITLFADQTGTWQPVLTKCGIRIVVSDEIKPLVRLTVNGFDVEPAVAHWKTSAEELVLPPAQYKLKATATGYSPQELDVDLTANPHSTWFITMVKLSGEELWIANNPGKRKLNVSVNPEQRPTLLLTINGNAVVPAPASWATDSVDVVLDASPLYKLYASADGYKPSNKQIDLSTNHRGTWTVDLQRPSAKEIAEAERRAEREAKREAEREARRIKQEEREEREAIAAEEERSRLSLPVLASAETRQFFGGMTAEVWDAQQAAIRAENEAMRDRISMRYSTTNTTSATNTTASTGSPKSATQGSSSAEVGRLTSKNTPVRFPERTLQTCTGCLGSGLIVVTFSGLHRAATSQDSKAVTCSSCKGTGTTLQTVKGPPGPPSAAGNIN